MYVSRLCRCLVIVLAQECPHVRVYSLRTLRSHLVLSIVHHAESTWRQPMQRPHQAPAILLSSGRSSILFPTRCLVHTSTIKEDDCPWFAYQHRFPPEEVPIPFCIHRCLRGAQQCCQSNYCCPVKLTIPVLVFLAFFVSIRLQRTYCVKRLSGSMTQLKSA